MGRVGLRASTNEGDFRMMSRGGGSMGRYEQLVDLCTEESWHATPDLPREGLSTNWLF